MLKVSEPKSAVWMRNTETTAREYMSASICLMKAAENISTRVSLLLASTDGLIPILKYSVTKEFMLWGSGGLFRGTGAGIGGNEPDSRMLS